MRVDLDAYTLKMEFFNSVMADLNGLPEKTEAACCRLNIKNLKQQVEALANNWKVKFASKLHGAVRTEMTDLLEFISGMEKRLNRPVKTTKPIRISPHAFCCYSLSLLLIRSPSCAYARAFDLHALSRCET